MLTLDRLLPDLRRALEAIGRAELVDEAAELLARGCAGAAVDVACGALRQCFPDRGGLLAGAARARSALASLNAFDDALRTTVRRRSGVEAPEPLTRAYIGLLLGYGRARALDAERARAAVADAARVLDTKDEVHAALLGGIRNRIDGALGEARAASRELAMVHARLERMPRYKFDRVRQMSVVLEPVEAVDAVRGFDGFVVVSRFWSRERPRISEEIYEAAARLPDPAAETRLHDIARRLGRGQPDGLFERQVLLRDLGDALREASSATAQAILREAIPQIAVTTDSYNTNSPGACCSSGSSTRWCSGSSASRLFGRSIAWASRLRRVRRCREPGVSRADRGVGSRDLPVAAAVHAAGRSRSARSECGAASGALRGGAPGARFRAEGGTLVREREGRREVFDPASMEWTVEVTSEEVRGADTETDVYVEKGTGFTEAHRSAVEEQVRRRLQDALDREAAERLGAESSTEVEGAVGRTYAAALAERAAELGAVEEMTERRDGSTTEIVIRIRER